MKKCIFISFIFFVGALAVSAQTPDQPQDCAAQLEVANQRLVKVLDAYEKALAVIAMQDAKDKARDDFDKIRLAQIAARDELITFYQKSLKKSKWQKAFEKIEKYTTLGVGIWIGTKL